MSLESTDQPVLRALGERCIESDECASALCAADGASGCVENECADVGTACELDGTFCTGKHAVALVSLGGAGANNASYFPTMAEIAFCARNAGETSCAGSAVSRQRGPGASGRGDARGRAARSAEECEPALGRAVDELSGDSPMVCATDLQTDVDTQRCQ